MRTSSRWSCSSAELDSPPAASGAPAGRSLPYFPRIGRWRHAQSSSRVIRPAERRRFGCAAGPRVSRAFSAYRSRLAQPRSSEQWASILRVAVTADAPPVLGDYRVVDRTLRFTPAFPFDPGRPYNVRFNGAAAGDITGPLAGTFALPALASTPTTTVSAVYPSVTRAGDLLRRYTTSPPDGLSSGIVTSAAGRPASGDGAFLRSTMNPGCEPSVHRVLRPGRVKRGSSDGTRAGARAAGAIRWCRSTWRAPTGCLETSSQDLCRGAARCALDTATWKLEPTMIPHLTFRRRSIAVCVPAWAAPRR